LLRVKSSVGGDPRLISAELEDEDAIADDLGVSWIDGDLICLWKR
jgi:hypothetical protein